MSDLLPRTKTEWTRAVKSKNIDGTLPLAVGGAFVSGSKFQIHHFLRLRVLYKSASNPDHLAKAPTFPKENLKKVESILLGEPEVLYLREVLKDKEIIGENWDDQNSKKSGRFALPMENLHTIASRKVHNIAADEDTSDTKIVISPVKPSNVIQSGIHNRSLSDPMGWTPTPTSRIRKDYNESSLSDIDVSRLSMALPGTGNDLVYSELQRAEDEFERGDFSPGDEATVNAALVNLITVLSMLLMMRGCVHHDRTNYSILSGDRKTELYKAGVDGLILHPEKDRENAFMEVKRGFRGQNQSVRRQIAAQMAAFIYHQDIELARQGTEQIPTKEIEKVNRKEGKQAARKGKEGAHSQDRIEYGGTRGRER